MNCPECNEQMWNYSAGVMRCVNDHTYTATGKKVEQAEIEPQNQETFSSATVTDHGSHITIKLTR